MRKCTRAARTREDHQFVPVIFGLVQVAIPRAQEAFGHGFDDAARILQIKFGKLDHAEKPAEFHIGNR